MIRIILLNLLLVSFLFPQDSSSFRIGIKGGINFSDITGAEYRNSSNLNNNHSKFGFNLGIIADNKIDSMFTVQFELLYNLTGSKWGQPLIKIGYVGIGYDGNYAIYELKYFTISVLGKFKSRIGNLIKDFDFVLGGSYSHNLSARQKWIVEINGDYDFETGPSDIRSQINQNEFGIVYGIKFPFANRKYYLSILFYNAITTLYSRPIPLYKDDFTEKLEMRNNTLSICFDLFF